MIVSQRICQSAFKHLQLVKISTLHKGNSHQAYIVNQYPLQLSPYLQYITYKFATTKQSAKVHQFNSQSSYFEILGVSPNATEQQIKSSYLQMVKRYHPDLSKEQNASQKFQLIQKAYEVISDPQERSKYRSTLNIPNPQRYQAAQQIKQKFKNFKRKQNVADEWQFSYKLFKKHYEQVDLKEKQYTKFQGQGEEYWMHKDQMQPDKKIFAQQMGMIVGSLGIAGAALYYMWM